ncbi:hypothetical protein FIV42_24995 [Persicimonas caeni]|uniref:DUF2938 domain-containing protein n=1 Tax=Persicimonas caeni TaxID=2292766 RepID=A0A4Y6PZY6_PERCE|nr:hypothetical protein [Persicimonas caeni]QDG53881.1 hypothetical protein FIV42_24995 [Persicimonas caeni]QED35102.1 hypothetical protein FRD00_24990 [Persicimonas caeni]
MSLLTGTPDTRTQHSEGLGLFNVFLAKGIPVALGIIGVIIEGWGGISWPGALISGTVAAVAMSAFNGLGRALGLTGLRFDEMLGTLMAEPRTTGARALGMFIHLAFGALLAVGWAYTMALFNWSTNWFSGMLWGAFVGALALLLVSSMGVIHPKMREHRQEDPGPAGTNLGRMTPVWVGLAHLVYGATMGLLYAGVFLE